MNKTNYNKKELNNVELVKFKLGKYIRKKRILIIYTINLKKSCKIIKNIKKKRNR